MFNKTVFFKIYFFAFIFAIAFFSSTVSFAESKTINFGNEFTSQADVRLVEWPAEGKTAPQSLRIRKDSSLVFRFERPIVRASISNPNIADITTAGDKDLLINAKDSGTVNLIIWDKDQNTASYTVESTIDTDKLYNVLMGVDPKSNLQVMPFNRTAAVYGTVETSMKLKQITEAAKAFDEHVVVYAKIREPKQILLEVRFAEVTRTGAETYKFDMEALTRWSLFRSFTGNTGIADFETEADPPISVTGSAVGYKNMLGTPDGTSTFGNLFINYITQRNWLQGYLKWLESKNILKVIARPNLVAKDGEEAEFIVGGEYPVPTIQNNAVQISYKEFGTSLKFTPEMLDNDIIKLKVNSEVSEIDTTTTVTSGGTTVPSINKRKYLSTIEMADNQTIVIGGLITQKVSKIVRKVPFLGDVPILKQVFRSEDYSRTDVELIVIITPHIIKPLELGEKKEFYKPEDVKNAVRPFMPFQPDFQADTMDKMLVQNESFRDFNKEHKDVEDMNNKWNQVTRTVQPAVRKIIYKPSDSQKASTKPTVVKNQPVSKTPVITRSKEASAESKRFVYVPTPVQPAQQAVAKSALESSSATNKGVFSRGYVSTPQVS